MIFCGDNINYGNNQSNCKTITFYNNIGVKTQLNDTIAIFCLLSNVLKVGNKKFILNSKVVDFINMSPK